MHQKRRSNPSFDYLITVNVFAYARYSILTYNFFAFLTAGTVAIPTCEFISYDRLFASFWISLLLLLLYYSVYYVFDMIYLSLSGHIDASLLLHSKPFCSVNFIIVLRP